MKRSFAHDFDDAISALYYSADLYRVYGTIAARDFVSELNARESVYKGARSDISIQDRYHVATEVIRTVDSMCPPHKMALRMHAFGNDCHPNFAREVAARQHELRSRGIRIQSNPLRYSFEEMGHYLDITTDEVRDLVKEALGELHERLVRVGLVPVTATTSLPQEKSKRRRGFSARSSERRTRGMAA